MSMQQFCKPYFELGRMPIALFTAYSALTGYLLGPQSSLISGIITFCSVFILAAGASALNQCQERRIDSLMDRTQRRPLPARTITLFSGFLFSVICIMAGLALLYVSAGTLLFIMGMLALFWYNIVYTLLKRLTAFAAVPGAIVGMIAPAIGWLSAGGSLFDMRLLALCFLFFMWQIPHFWLQLLDHGDEYRRAGLPSLTSVFGRQQIARMTFVWICAAAASGLLLPLFNVITSPYFYFLLLPGAAQLIIAGFKLTIQQGTRVVALSAFKTCNAYILFVMTLLSLDSLFLHP